MGEETRERLELREKHAHMALNERANCVCHFRLQSDAVGDGGDSHSPQLSPLIDKDKHERFERRLAFVLDVKIKRDAYDTQLHAEGEVAEDLQHLDLVRKALEEQVVLQLKEERSELVVVEALRVRRRKHAYPLNHSFQQRKQSKNTVV